MRGILSYGQKLQELPPGGSSRLRLWKSRGKDSLHVALVGLDHFLDHLAADGAGFAGGQVAVVAVLQIDADLPRRSFTY